MGWAGLEGGVEGDRGGLVSAIGWGPGSLVPEASIKACSVSRTLEHLEPRASPSSPQGGMPKAPVPVPSQGTPPTKLWCQQR